MPRLPAPKEQLQAHLRGALPDKNAEGRKRGGKAHYSG